MMDKWKEWLTGWWRSVVQTTNQTDKDYLLWDEDHRELAYASPESPCAMMGIMACHYQYDYDHNNNNDLVVTSLTTSICFC
ncbi:hypothetical protein O6P43_030282 [Quillaja saponaria]|uniref:Uncharacterized protein n=1 Tax=Quillaja saponaria TaxID=32244 RepID=A0AAD7P7Y2_QUISA|nr:hypothetical protein O6P43_030282 [Quillaja saponaria]